MTMKNYSAGDFRLAFQQGFNPDTWQDWLVNFFGAADIRRQPEPVKLPPSEKGVKGFLLGELMTSDGVRMGLFRYTVPEAQIERRRVGLNSLVNPWLKYDFDAALAVFDAKGTNKWRFSLVADMRGDKTSPRRYTYVFGDSMSQYRTAVERFVKVGESHAQSPARPVSYAALKEAFSVEALTKEFYSELFAWYQRAVSSDSGVYFPNSTETADDDFDDIDKKIIRLITRLMFVWFIKQKELVPDALFDEEQLRQILRDFDPQSTEQGSYYNAILQNLFFATLNRAIEDEEGGKRGFAKLKSQRDVKTLYRYAEMFSISEPEVIRLFARIPFMNGGLFECLDKTKKNDGVEAYNYDGFSRNDAKFDNGRYKHRAFIPNKLFFDPESGLLSILRRYNFTIEENTPNEQQVALDPELLGKVFENLLGAYNPETKETARKESGSFYTPREIVNYMVDESLIAYLGDTPTVRSIFKDDFELDDLHWSEYQLIAGKLKSVKILDPACGSGAFPMGLLNRIVDLLQKIETDKTTYELKLNIIENCLYGCDIQSIATQITKLRFFISLICDCDKDDSMPNFGIPTLPNLETKFITANSLIGIYKVKQRKLFVDPEIEKTKEALRSVRHEHFKAKTAPDKQRLRKQDEKLREQLVQLLSKSNAFAPEDAKQMAAWNPYDQNAVSPFFDPEWMFGITDGFDIVIGNPPYVESRNSCFSDELKDLLQNQIAMNYSQEDRRAFPRGADLLIFFFELSFRLLNKNGINTFITENSWLSTDYGKEFQNYLLKYINVKGIVDSDYKYFEIANINTIISFFIKNSYAEKYPVQFFHCHESLDIHTCNIASANSNHSSIEYNIFNNDSALLKKYKWGFLFSTDSKLINLLEKMWNMQNKRLANKISVGQGLNITKDHIIRYNDSNNVPYFTSENGSMYSWGKSETFVSNDVISDRRRIPLLILPRGLGTHFCCMNEINGYSSSYVEIYEINALTDDEKLKIWTFCNSSLLWLLREYTGRCNLGGGMLKAEATDLKSIPLCFDFDNISEVRSIYELARLQKVPSDIEDAINSEVHKRIDKIVFDYFGIPASGNFVIDMLVDRFNWRCKRSRTNYPRR